ncbi:transposase [Glaciimonas sp. GG7]
MKAMTFTIELIADSCHAALKSSYSLKKSNQGIVEELTPILSYLMPPAKASCLSSDCENYGEPIESASVRYYRNGNTGKDSPRYRCRAFGKTFSKAATSTSRQRLPHKNKLIFKLLMNKSSFSQICEVANVDINTVSHRLSFIHTQRLRT